MSTGLIDCVANGGPVNVTASYLGLNASVAITVAAGGGLAWQQTAPLSTALVADWPGRDYASTAAFQSNSLSRYANTSFGTETTLDSSVLYGGYNTLANDRTIANTASRLIIPSYATQTDIVYHVRRAISSRQVNDLVPGVNYTNNPSFGNSTHTVLCGLAFDTATYALPFNNTGTTTGGIVLMLDYVSGLPVYKLVASIYSSGGSLLTTTSPNVTATTLGDDAFTGEQTDYFLRTYLSGSTTLMCEAYMGVPGYAPKQIATCSLTMISGNAPMPHYGMNNIAEQWFLTPAVSRMAFNQIIDNAANPNTALDFAAPVSANGIGIGEHGSSIVRRTVNLEQYASDAAFQADMFTGTPPEGRLISYLGTPAPYLITATDAAHNNKKFFRMGQPLNSSVHASGLHDNPFQVQCGEMYWKESLLFSSGWSIYGAGVAVTTLNQNVVGSGTSQTVNVVSSASLQATGGLIGYGTANSERVAYTAIGTNTITGVFLNSHSTGDEVSQEQGAGYKLSQVNSTMGGQSVDLRMELVPAGISSYLLDNSANWDSAYPGFTDAGVGGLSGGVTATGCYRDVLLVGGTATDFVSIPAGNAQGVAAYSATGAVGIELQFRGRAKIWYDADYGRYRTRLEHYIGIPGSAPYRYQMVEAFSQSSITSGNIIGMDYGENFNERTMAAQNLDRWDCECCDPNATSVGADPYGVVAALGLAVPAAGTCGSATSPTTTTLTYPVTAPATGSTVLHVIQEVNNGTVWVPNATGTAWTAGAGGTQNIVVTGLTTATNYTGKIRFRLVSNYGMGAAVVCADGTTS